jgi:hypothetical protein
MLFAGGGGGSEFRKAQISANSDSDATFAV